MRLYKSILLFLLCFDGGLSAQDQQPRTTRTSKDSLNKIKFEKLISTKNLISVNALGFFNSSVSLSYVREFPKYHFHIYVPVSVGYGHPNWTFPGYFLRNYIRSYTSPPSFNHGENNSPWFYDYQVDLISRGFSVSDFYIKRKSYETGLGIHFQYDSKCGLSYFIGPYVGASQFIGTYTEVTLSFSTSYPYTSTVTNYKKKEFVATKYSLILDNGFLWRINKNFNAIFLFAFSGAEFLKFEGRDLKKAYNYNSTFLGRDFPSLPAKLNLSVGYRF